VTVTVEARRANGGTIGTANVTVDITAGQTTVAALSLDLEDTYMTNPNGALEADVTIRDGSTIIQPIAAAASRTGFPRLGEAPTVLSAGLDWLSAIGQINNKLYICDPHNNRIRLLDINGGALETLAEETFDWSPQFLAVAGTKIYVSDNNSKIRMIDTANGHAVTTLLDGVQAAGLTVVGDKLYIAAHDWDWCIKSLSLVDNSTVETVVPPGSLSGPPGIASDGTVIYIADYFNHAVKRFDTLDGINPPLTTVVSTNLSHPFTLAVNGGKVYVADPWVTTYGRRAA
jgi:hypothetical protein